jgi:Do/DeqQ family serine protease
MTMSLFNGTSGPGSRRRRATTAAALFAAGSLTAFAFGSGEPTFSPTASAAAAAPAAALAPAPGADSRTIGANHDSYAGIVDTVAPTVVTIHSTRHVRGAEDSAFEQDPFEQFFGRRGGPRVAPQEHREAALGSGVIVSKDGYILTNHHVIDGADDVRVELTDRRSFKATVVGSDAPSDLAVLKIDATNLSPLPLGNSDAVRVGDVVLAVGNPMGVGQTVTMGIVSAKGRATGLGDGSFEDFLQTDAPINHGNSGGALVNTRGELVGINSQMLSPSGGSIGIGFAIPANMAQNVMKSLIAEGRVHRGMIGVTVQQITPELARSLRLDHISGALVTSVQPNGPAAKAGIERGDVITAVNGGSVADSNALRNEMAAFKPGSRVQLTLVRDGDQQTVTATLSELPSTVAENGRDDGESPTGGAGLSVQPVTPEVARQLGIDGTSGLVVTSVDPSGPAADAGFQRGDVIQEVNGETVKNVATLRDAIKGAKDRPALVLVRRENASIFLTLGDNS